MKTKKQLFEAAKKGSLGCKLLQLIDVTADLRNIIIAYKLEDEGVDIGPVREEMKKLYIAEVKDG